MKPGYTIRVVDALGNVEESGYDLPRVSDVISSVWSSTFSQASNWGYNLAVEALRPKTVDLTKIRLKKQGFDPTSKRDARAEEGTETHAYLHALASGDMSNPDNGYKAGVWSFWQDYASKDVLASEKALVSLAGRYGGRVDLVYKLGNGLHVLDLKTRPRLDVRTTDKIQVAAYSSAWLEMFNQVPTWGHVLLVAPDGDHVLKDVDLVKYTRVWRATLNLYNTLHGYGRGV